MKQLLALSAMRPTTVTHQELSKSEISAPLALSVARVWIDQGLTLPHQTESHQASAQLAMHVSQVQRRVTLPTFNVLQVSTTIRLEQRSASTALLALTALEVHRDLTATVATTAQSTQTPETQSTAIWAVSVMCTTTVLVVPVSSFHALMELGATKLAKSHANSVRRVSYVPVVSRKCVQTTGTVMDLDLFTLSDSCVLMEPTVLKSTQILDTDSMALRTARPAQQGSSARLEGLQMTVLQGMCAFRMQISTLQTSKTLRAMLRMPTLALSDTIVKREQKHQSYVHWVHSLSKREE